APAVIGVLAPSDATVVAPDTATPDATLKYAGPWPLVPSLPGSPFAPGAPGAPGAPSWPSAPGAPSLPFAPGAPVAPFGPATTASPARSPFFTEWSLIWIPVIVPFLMFLPLISRLAAGATPAIAKTRATVAMTVGTDGLR